MKRSLIAALLLSFSLFFTSCGGSGTNLQIPGVTGPKVTLEAQDVIVDMAFEALQIEGSLQYSIPKLPHSYVTLSTDEVTKGARLVFKLNIEDILVGYGTSVDPMTLPGGRPLPGVASGKLPATAFTIEKFKNVTFYIGTEVFGFFVPFDAGFDANIITARYYIGGKRGGNLSLVGRDANGENSGILLLLDFGNKTKKLLKNYLAKN